MNDKLQKIRQNASERQKRRQKRKKEKQSEFEAERLIHQTKLNKESQKRERVNQSFKRISPNNINIIDDKDVLSNKTTVGFNKDLFNGR